MKTHNESGSSGYTPILFILIYHTSCTIVWRRFFLHRIQHPHWHRIQILASIALYKIPKRIFCSHETPHSSPDKCILKALSYGLPSPRKIFNDVLKIPTETQEFQYLLRSFEPSFWRRDQLGRTHAIESYVFGTDYPRLHGVV